ncbi:MAG: response regulator transcription factor [Luteolibacter sp.]
MNPRKHIGLVDDDPAFLRALQRLLRSAGYDVRAWSSPADFFEENQAESPDCLVVDMDMPGMSGLEFQKALAEMDPGLPVVFLTGKGDIPMTVRAMQHGAVNFLTKPVAEDELFPAIEAALETASRNQEHRLRSAAAREGYNSLTPREKEVLTHLITGKLNKQIAGDLGTSEQTIKVHRMRVLQKMGVRSLPELVHLANLLAIKA